MKFKKLILTGGVLLASVMALQGVSADTNVQKVIDETYVQPDYVLGYSLSDEQRSTTLNLLGYTDGDTQIKTLTTSAYSTIMNVADDASLQLYSSVKIQKLGSSETLDVDIVTPENITKVTENMYRNAATTLGIEHAKITVAAPLAVTGESALAGIYYSLEESGAEVSDENKALAQEELSALSDINAENQGKEGYDADKLNVALTDIKTAVAESKDKNLTEDDVRSIVEKTLDNYGLTSSVTANQITLIVNFAFNLSKSDVISNTDFVNTLTSLKNSIVSESSNLFDNINLNFDATSAIESSKGFFTSIWDQIVAFFKQFVG